MHSLGLVAIAYINDAALGVVVVAVLSDMPVAYGDDAGVEDGAMDLSHSAY